VLLWWRWGGHCRGHRVEPPQVAFAVPSVGAPKPRRRQPWGNGDASRRGATALLTGRVKWQLLLLLLLIIMIAVVRFFLPCVLDVIVLHEESPDGQSLRHAHVNARVGARDHGGAGLQKLRRRRVRSEARRKGGEAPPEPLERLDRQPRWLLRMGPRLPPILGLVQLGSVRRAEGEEDKRRSLGPNHSVHGEQVKWADGTWRHVWYCMVWAAVGEHLVCIQWVSTSYTYNA
jgi:hypothetical protein